MSASEKIQRNKKVGFEDGEKSSPRESRSRARGRKVDRRAKSMDVRNAGQPLETRKRDRSLIGLVRQGSRKSVSSLVKLFEAGKSYYMNEGRKCHILLPDERRLEILIQPKLLTSELLDIVASHFKLKEKEYFGLAFLDETNHYNWLQLDKKVLEHDLPRKQGVNLAIYFLVRFYVDSITQLKDTATVELFYLNAKQAVFKGQIECDSETAFELAAHVLQTSQDYLDDASTKAELKKLPLIPTSALKEHPSIQFCEERVIHYYKKLSGTGRGSAIVNYMTIVESLPTYSIHYFEVKDKKDIPWWLGISHKGIGVYDKNDKNVPRRVFVWKSLENLYYREKKFSIEVHDPKRVVHTLSSFNLYEDAIRECVEDTDDLSDAITDPSTQVSVSRRTFGPGNVNVHAWFGATPQLTKCIWQMAVAQHQFYHERKSSRVNLPSVRSVSELATELSRSTSSLPGSLGSDISRSGSSASLPSLGASRVDLNFDPADTAKVQREMYAALKARRDALEDVLRKHTEELKMLCIKEGELTGVLPKETPLAAGEEPPVIRRRVGTAFTLSTDAVHSKDKTEDEALKQLELELELQKQITSAAHKLASDKSVSRFVRKQRRHSFIKAQTKLKDMEKKLHHHQKGSITSSPSRSGRYDDSEVFSPTQSPLIPRGPRGNYQHHEGRGPGELSPLHRSNTAPTKDLAAGEREIASVTLCPTNSSPSLEVGYKPNSVYQNQYRNQTYPTLPSRSQSNTSNQSDFDNSKTGSQCRLEGSLDSGFSSTNNMYNVNSRRTSRYESNQDLVSPVSELDNVFDNKLQLQYKHGSMDNAYRRTVKNYGSLERNLKKRQNREYERKLSDTDSITAEISDNSPSRFGKRTSKSEYDLSSKCQDHVAPPGSKETDFPLASRGYNNINTPSRVDSQRFSDRSDRVDRYTSSLNRGESMSIGRSESIAINRDDTPINRGDSAASRGESGRRMIELPVQHETSNTSRSTTELFLHGHTKWTDKDASTVEASPIIQSPTKKNSNAGFSIGVSDGGEGGDTAPQGMCYSPRDYEGSRGQSTQFPYNTEHSITVKRVESPQCAPQATSSKIVTVTKMSPHVEVSKPFEMKDFYKYSEKLRRQRLVEQYHQALVGSRASSPSQHSSDGETHSTTSYHRSAKTSATSSGHSTPSSVSHFQSNSSPFSSPASSRHMIPNSPYIQQNDHNTGYGITTRTSSTSSGYNVSSSTSRVQYTVQSQSGRMVYKAQHHSSKQSHYQPPTSMKCEAVRSVKDIQRGQHDMPNSSRKPPLAPQHQHHRQRSTPEKMVNSSLAMNSSFHLPSPGSLSSAFSSEMLEWYDGESNQPTSV